MVSLCMNKIQMRDICTELMVAPTRGSNLTTDWALNPFPTRYDHLMQSPKQLDTLSNK